MCEQCSAETVELGYLFPSKENHTGWRVVRATRKGNMMDDGDLGLVQSDDPDYVIPCTVKCIKDPSFDMSDEEFDNMSDEVSVQHDLFLDWAYHVSSCLKGHPLPGHSLVECAEENGWDYSKHKIFDFWLAHKIAEIVENFKP